jgi:CheY-like chemotaxis protein/two-component sensor histidine kinase
MTRLVNDLLDMTRVKHGLIRLERDAVGLNETIAAALDTMRPAAEKKGLRLQFEPGGEPLVVNADPERLAQVLDNLLRNAVASTDRGDIGVSVRREGPLARIAIRDHGAGISAEAIHGIFEPYWRGGEGGDGLGLGLAVVKALVETHGGTVACNSDGPGTGSEFSFTMPLASPGPTGPPPTAIRTRPRRRVLVVDDQRDLADTFALLLESLGQDVAVAYDASSALTIARRHHPEIAFLDVAMPGTSGSELAVQLRHEFDGASLAIVAVTGHGRHNERVRGGPFDQHLLKPVTLESVAALLDGIVGRRANATD